jgi:hypothetical protein
MQPLTDKERRAYFVLWNACEEIGKAEQALKDLSDEENARKASEVVQAAVKWCDRLKAWMP